jgi:hypothetical protein
MRLLLLALAMLPLHAMQAPSKERIDIFIDQEIEYQVTKQKPLRLLERGDFIAYLKRQHPEWFNNPHYEVRFVATFRGSSFEVFKKADNEIEKSIIDIYKKQ